MQEKTEKFNAATTKAVPRRNFLKCMAWASGGVVWTVSAGGLLTACGPVSSTPAQTSTQTESFSFVQISDTHIGFNAEGVNTDVPGTLKQTIERINALAKPPALVLHTGDISHNSKAAEFDTAAQLIATIKAEKVFYVPGEHDVIGDNGTAFRQKFLPASSANSWYSFDYKGVHFIALSNSGELDAFGMLGTAQLEWLKKDLAGVKKDTPLVVFAHVPLYSVYPAWGWETKDGNSALALLMPYSAVTILNGHIHQVLSKVEGNIRFYTASATAFPQHRPGVDKPNAYKLPASELLQSIGYRTVTLVPGAPEATITDTTLAGTPAAVATVAPISATITSTPAATVAVSSNGGIDVGAVSDFGEVATIPKAVKVQLPNQKNLSRLFVVQNNGEYQALSDICTHQGCEVDWNTSQGRFLCPCHGSEYDRQGKNVAGPAPQPLARFKTSVVNGHLVIAVQPG